MTRTHTTNNKITDNETPILQNEIIPQNEIITTIPQPVCTECTICAEKYNKTTRLPVKCPYCDFESCRECSQRYIVEQPFAKCMSPGCGKEWTRGFLRSSFTSKFINKTYKESRERILYEHEISLLPATQYLVEREIQKERIIEEIHKLSSKQHEIMRQIDSLRIRYNRIGTGNDTETQETNANTLYVRKCSDPDCRGFLSSQWKCGVCTKWTCNKCHENIGTDRNVEHTCNPDNVETAKLLEKDTKPCPQCHTNIFKIDGCDQMWCTQCNTAFSWKTGKIIVDEIHNPHYFEWMRKHRGAPAPNHGGCHDNRINIHSFYDRQSPSHEIDTEIRTCITIYRNIVHLRRVDMERFNYDKERPNRDLRVQYMRNFISEDKFKVLLQQNDKKHQKNRDIVNIINMLHDTVYDILARILSFRVLTKEIFEAHFKEIDEIVNYANDCLEEVSKTYGSVQYYFTNKVVMHTTKYRDREI